MDKEEFWDALKINPEWIGDCIRCENLKIPLDEPPCEECVRSNSMNKWKWNGINDI